MRVRRSVPSVRILVAVVTIAASLVGAERASAQAATTSTAASTTPTPHTASPYALAILEGLAKLREGDAHAAQIAFQRALAADRTRSEAHYLLGVSMRRNQSLPAALDAFREALLKAQQASDLLGEARARFAIAEVLSQMGEHQRSDAARAWQDLTAFADAHPTVIAPEVPRAYTTATERVATLATAMEPVRERIRSRERETHHGSGGHHGARH